MNKRMRIGCKWHVKMKLDPKEGRWFFDAIDLNHNHQLHPEKQMTRFMRAHKSMEDEVKNLMEVMIRAGVQHQAQMNVMSELYGVIPHSEIGGTKPPYVCTGCFIHTYSNKMINRFHI
jgi:hypothetical protein